MSSPQQSPLLRNSFSFFNSSFPAQSHSALWAARFSGPSILLFSSLVCIFIPRLSFGLDFPYLSFPRSKSLVEHQDRGKSNQNLSERR